MLNPHLPTRRQALATAGGGFGLTSLAGLLAAEQKQGQPQRSNPPAKHVIFLFMTGGPSHMDLFDPKPALQKFAGQRPKTVNLRTERVTKGLLASPFKFHRSGQSGVEVSELLPRLGQVIDEICVIRSMYTFNPTHTPARNLMHSGNIAVTRPTIGAWLNYGLGSENENLPGFVAISHPRSGKLWRSGFLPSKFQGTQFTPDETAPEKMIRYLKNPVQDKASQRQQLDLVQQLNRVHLADRATDGFLEGRIQSMETAFRMQFAASEAFDVRTETKGVRELYGENTFGNSCLLARRLVERGVRYVQVFSGPGQPWDDHHDIDKNLRQRCPDIDRACAGLITDLKQRGLLDDTLIVWGGEFGRTPVSEAGTGRDHNPYGFTVWMAGGGIRGGVAHGATDEFGFRAVENRVNIHDLHATLLHQMGIDHEQLTYRFSGRDYRLTDVHGRVLHELIA
ncbi:MAG: DUF1501 domain-containing protein [Planctomycetota bacterium]|nr:DUF1501 domain-containing protein [Planctomycetota bacterium]